MNTIEILNTETLNRFSKRFLITKPVNRFLAVSAGTLLAVCAMLNANAQWVYSVNIVGCVPDMTSYLLTAPLTTAQRQALHAQNFNQLPPYARAAYLHAVAYAVSFAVGSDGELPTSAMLAQHLKDVSSWNGENGTMIYTAPAIPPEYSQLLAFHTGVVKTALQELNVKIADQVANNTSFHQAMYAGGVYGFTWSYDGVVFGIKGLSSQVSQEAR